MFIIQFLFTTLNGNDKHFVENSFSQVTINVSLVDKSKIWRFISRFDVQYAKFQKQFFFSELILLEACIKIQAIAYNAPLRPFLKNVQIFYYDKWSSEQEEEIPIPACGDPCKIQDFVKLASDNFSGDWEVECQKVEIK